MTIPNGRRSNRIRVASKRSARMVAGLLVAAVAVAGCGSDDDAAENEPTEIIERYEAAYNLRDIDAIMDLFSEESVITGHPFVADMAGLSAIRDMQLNDLGAAADTDAYEFLNIESSGGTVTWGHEWTNRSGVTWCARGHEAVVVDGQILSWIFAPDRQECSDS